jgi:glycosyltransferase involved in cell wall biosynthesis
MAVTGGDRLAAGRDLGREVVMVNDVVKLSVVLATYNRADTLRRTLECLAGQNLDPALYEVLVVDDGSPDHTGRVVAEAAPTFPCRLAYLHHGNRGPGYTQNRGILEARAPLVLLMADDIWLAHGALRAHLARHERSPEPEVAVLGKVLQSPEMTQSVFLRHWDPFGFRDLEGGKELPSPMFWVCNISVKRGFMLRHGMFREVVGKAGPSDHHDAEVGYRLGQHGLRILYDEEAWGFHYHPCTLDQMIARYYERGLNWPAYRKLAPAPEVTVLAHVLTLRTLPDYLRVLRGPNSLHGADRHLFWHVARKAVRLLAFSRLTVPWLWKPLADRAEKNPWLAKLMNRRFYRALMYYYFERGIRDAPERFGG